MYDFIIVGAGSAGCVVAFRLSEEINHEVLLLEAGPSHHDRRYADRVSTPGRFQELWLDPGTAWQYSTEPEPHLHNRQVFWPRGKLLGGSGSINSMIYIRGNRRDYDHWAYLGNERWSYHDVLPFFKKSEHQHHFHDPKVHGENGPIDIANIEFPNPASQAFVEACHALGAERHEDFNDGEQKGAALYQVYVWNGQRVSSATGFLDRFHDRNNLRIETSAFARRILFDGTRAVGVEYEVTTNGDTVIRQEFARHEVILACGAVDSPKLLMLSGVGPRETLERHGIPTVAELPGVGQNLRDHTIVALAYRYPGGEPSAPASAGAAEGGMFVRTRPGLEHSPPDLQYHFSHWMLVEPKFLIETKTDLHTGFSIISTLVRPQSLGEITLRSANIYDKPVIRANYLSARRDLEALLYGLKRAREIGRHRLLEPYRGEEFVPGANVESDGELEEYIREAAGGLFHCACTCRMGWDHLAVVDPELRVHGIDALRVADASVMPEIVSGNTNCASVMIAEKAAALIAAAPAPALDSWYASV